MEPHETAAPDEEGTDGSEENANDEECGKNSARGEYRLPCLQPLLLEGSI